MTWELKWSWLVVKNIFVAHQKNLIIPQVTVDNVGGGVFLRHGVISMTFKNFGHWT